jgi:hypothetical protein
MLCDVVRAALSDFEVCEDTLDGARVATHCLYPSFENVHIYVVKIGDDFRVHDGAGAYRNAWAHGRDSAMILRMLSAEASHFRLKCVNETIVSPDVPESWLQGAILGVANASAAAANRIVSRIVQVSEEALIEKIAKTLTGIVTPTHIAREFTVRGRSGGERHFDFAIRDGDSYNLLINGVSPHHASINSKYVAFADAELERENKFAVFDRELETDDTALLQQVASIVPLAALPSGARRVLTHIVI